MISNHLKPILTKVVTEEVTRLIIPTGGGVSTLAPIVSIATKGRKVTMVTKSDSAAKLWSATSTMSYGSQTTIGYATYHDYHLLNKPTVSYVTRSYLINDLLSSFTEKTCDVWTDPIYIFDQVEDYDLELATLLNLWRYCAEQQGKVPRIVLIANRQFDFNLPVLRNIQMKSEPYVINSQNVPYQTNYGKKSYSLTDDKIYNDMTDVIKKYHNTNQTGDFLAVVPTDAEVQYVAGLLTDIRNGKVIQIRDNVDTDTIRSLTSPSSVRRIIITTSRSESAVELSVNVVIDSLRYLKAIKSVTDSTHYVINYIDRETQLQRIQRVSRISKGLYIPMSTELSIKKLQSSDLLEAFRVPNHRMALKLFDAGLQPSNILTYPPGGTDLALINAQQLGLITDGILTPAGKFVTQIPLSMENATALYRWLEQKFPPFPMIMILATIDRSYPRYWSFPQKSNDFRKQLSSYKKEHYAKYRGANDIETNLNVMQDLYRRTKGLSNGARAVSSWAHHNKINKHQIKETLALISALRNILTNLKYKVQIGPFDSKNALNALRPIMVSTHSKFVMKLNQRSSLYHSIETGISYGLDSYNTFSEMSSAKYNYIIGVVTTTYETKEHHVRHSVIQGLNIDSVDESQLQLIQRTNVRTVKTTDEGCVNKLKSRMYLKCVESWARSFNVAELRLDPELLNIWNTNGHLRGVFYNNYTLGKQHPDIWNFTKVGRQMEVQDTVLRYTGDDTISYHLGPNVPSQTFPYHERYQNEIRTVNYWGQRKLLLSAIEFLSTYAKSSDASGDYGPLALSGAGTRVVYAGASPGLYFDFLANMFPHLIFDLYDPREMHATSSSVNIFKQFFTDDTARQYEGQKVIFMSDIRGECYTESNKTNPDVEEKVQMDMEAQKRWVKIMKPRVAWLKFRLPYTKGITRYLKGHLYIQPWTSPSSTENRLVVTDRIQEADYDNQWNSEADYDNLWHSNAMYYHNQIQRYFYYDHPIDCSKHDCQGLDHCYDCSREILILGQYLSDQRTNNPYGPPKTIDDINGDIIALSREISKVLSKTRTLHTI